ncbi:Butyryl-CoA dehydrogenase [Rhodoferax ferrireducens T118]|uniref:Butyryl-CoA dehydrogenase n=1 Tax=Albidiferax ferrireducens (strain ATCC BAA-621 / DSM 15236 / T118) TaxID=338969 RepID=Q21QT2_ALBFT|nr:acyl-CoA dehydrogenase family protein [Rhodoferax ferrireducens]ABD71862.1 Butyryl-CoA dehydrogenase [Rhodoferax ferrireducens T118]ABD71871.1 Butyryl-CoA dehydrogenase [Rhodoferax ferrireducens T118]
MAEASNDQQEFVDAVEVWVEKELRPVARQYDLADEYPHAIVEQMKELGLFGATIGEEYGGLGLSAWTYAQIVIKVASVWMAPSGIFNSHLIAASAIERNGTEEQKRKYLPKMATGEMRGSLGLTEPNAGSDLQAIRTVAKLDGDHYVVNGSKTWITNSLHGHMTLLLVKTDPEAQPRHKGMSMLIAEKGPGYNVDGKLKKMGYRAIDTCQLSFDDYRVPKENLLGGVEGRGFIQTAGGLELGRINVASRGAGIAEGSLKMALRYAQERSAFGKPIWQHQAIQLKLADMVTQVEGAKRLIENAARKYDSGERCDLEAAMAKLAGSEAGVHCSQEAMRIFGGYSLSVEYEIERFYRDSMLMVIGEGTNEILRQVIAKQLIERYKI